MKYKALPCFYFMRSADLPPCRMRQIRFFDASAYFSCIETSPDVVLITISALPSPHMYELPFFFNAKSESKSPLVVLTFAVKPQSSGRTSVTLPDTALSLHSDGAASSSQKILPLVDSAVKESTLPAVTSILPDADSKLALSAQPRFTSIFPEAVSTAISSALPPCYPIRQQRTTLEYNILNLLFPPPMQ